MEVRSSRGSRSQATNQQQHSQSPQRFSSRAERFNRESGGHGTSVLPGRMAQSDSFSTTGSRRTQHGSYATPINGGGTAYLPDPLAGGTWAHGHRQGPNDPLFTAGHGGSGVGGGQRGGAGGGSFAPPVNRFPGQTQPPVAQPAPSSNQPFPSPGQPQGPSVVNQPPQSQPPVQQGGTGREPGTPRIPGGNIFSPSQILNVGVSGSGAPNRHDPAPGIRVSNEYGADFHDIRQCPVGSSIWGSNNCRSGNPGRDIGQVFVHIGEGIANFFGANVDW